MSRYTNINVWRRTFDPRPCEECGRNYKPNTTNQRFCSRCKKKAYSKIQKVYLEKKKKAKKDIAEELEPEEFDKDQYNYEMSKQ